MKKLFKFSSWSPATVVLGTVILVLWLSCIVWSQGQNFGNGSISSGTVANLPANPAVGALFQVTDALGAGNCSTGGSNSLALCRWNGSSWVAIGDGGQGLYPANFNVVSTNCGSQPNCFTGKVDTNVIFDGSWSITSSTVTTSGTDPVFKAPSYPATCTGPSSTCDLGKTAFGTDCSVPTNPEQCVSSIPVGTITAITSAHVATVSTTSTTASVAESQFIWGTPDGTPLAAAADACYISGSPCAVLLPCGTMLVQTPQIFNPTRVTRSGNAVGFKGCTGVGGTRLEILPNMVMGGNTVGTVIRLNLEGGQSLTSNGFGDSAEDILIDGGGIDLPAAGTYTGTVYSVVSAVGGSHLKNVMVQGYLWNAAATKVIYGMECLGCTAINSGSYVGGNFSCHATGILGFTATLTGGYCGSSNFSGLVLDGGKFSVVTDLGIGTQICTLATINCGAVQVASGSTVLWHDLGSSIIGTLFMNGGTSLLTGTLIQNGGGGTAAAWINVGNSAANVTLQGTRFPTAFQTFQWLNISAGTVTNLGGNNTANTGGVTQTGGFYINNGASAISSTTPVTSSNPTINTDQNLIQIPLQAGYFNDSFQVTHIDGSGIYSSTTASQPALTFKVKLCTVSGCGSGTVVALANIVTSALNTTALTNATWNLEMTCVTNTVGTTGNLVCHGKPGLTLDTGSTLGTPDSVFADTNTATLSNIDLTAALFLQFTVAQSVVGASNSYTQQLANIR